jgi:hypothetical protein
VIGNGAFADCSSLMSICIPASVERLEGGVATWGQHGGCFGGCRRLGTVIFESGSRLRVIGNRAFHDCSSLRSICIPASVEKLDGDQNLYGDGGCFAGCSRLGTVTFESGSTLFVIENYAFHNCSSLTSICIPASVARLGGDQVLLGEGHCFEECSSLSTVTFEAGSRLGALGSCTFSGCSSLTSICIPAGVVGLMWNCFRGCGRLSSVTFESGSMLSVIWNGAFQDCSALSSICLPASVETLENNCFRGCRSLSTVTFEAGSRLSVIECNAFRECISLCEVPRPRIRH